MDNSNVSQQSEQAVLEQQKAVPWPLIIFIILVIISIAVAWQFTGNNVEPVPVAKPMAIIEPVVEDVIEEPEAIVEEPVEPVIEESIPEVIENPLPSLDDSDEWLKIKLPEITWRKELLKLVIDEDMIRRFVVFTDNFAQGIIAYEHSPFVQPNSKFAPGEQNDNIEDSEQVQTNVTQQVWQWNESSTERFSRYVELLRSMDSESLVSWYFEMKPLIDEAYAELGYGDDDFTHTLQDAITRVLDMELPKTSMALVQPSVVYKFANPELEALPESDKLLLRLGKDNLLVIKSVLLELHEKLAQQENGVR